jgi:hypothetical protein
MSLPKPPPPTPDPAPPAQGATALQLGGDSLINRQQGAIGRLALRIPGQK